MILSIHEPFARKIVAKHDDHLLDYGPDEQIERVVEAMERVSKVKLFAPISDLEVDLAGFGTAPISYVTDDDNYLLLSDIADALGWPLYKAHAWAERELSYAVADQRRKDEERGDGKLGWQYLLDYIDLGVCLTMDDPEARPDAGGKKHSDAGDWLISQDRLPALLCSSPWGKEFLNNVGDHMGLMFQKVMGDKLKDSPTVYADGTPTGKTAYDMFGTDLTEEEALHKARRGPALDEEGDR